MSPATDAAPAAGGSRPVLTVDLAAIAANWRALDALSGPAETAAVVKADAYGLGLAPVAAALRDAGARTFFVAQMHEGAALRAIVGPGAVIHVFNGFMPDDLELCAANDLTPVLSSPAQIAAFSAAAYAFHDRPRAALHLETGINRLGLAPADLDALLAAPPRDLDITLILSHLACADDPASPMNARQRQAFAALAARAGALAPDAPLSLAATGGILLGPGYHFDLVRPGIGLYGGLPFANARPVVSLTAPFLQVRAIAKGETVGYGATWTAPRDGRIGILPLGYADGFLRATTGARVFVLGRPAPVVGRVSMDMLTVDLTGLPEPAPGDHAEILGPHQTIDDLAAAAGTIGYEILTSLGARHQRRHVS